MSNDSFLVSAFLVALVFTANPLDAKAKHPSKHDQKPQDQITVVAHLPISGGPVTDFFITEHYRRNYLYAEHESGTAITLIDVSEAGKPRLLADVAYPSGQGSAGPKQELVAVTGDEALVASSSPIQRAIAPQIFRIMNFTDPLHPVVQREFSGVTAIKRDEKRGLIFLADSEGVWVLQEHYAQDPESEKEWEHMMLDNR